MIYVIERTLGAAAGHHHTQLAAIQELAGERPVVFLTSRGQTVFANRGNVRTVLCSQVEIASSENAAISSDVEALLRNVEDGAAIFVPTARDYDIRLALALCGKLGGTIKIYLRVLSAEVLERLSVKEREMLAEKSRPRPICLLTDTVDLTAHIFATYGLHASANFLLPCSFPVQEDVTFGASSKSASEPFKLGFLGQPRREKGASSIAPILKQLRDRLAREPHPKRVEFLFQTPARMNKLRFWRYVVELKAIEIGSFVKRGNLVMQKQPAFVDGAALKKMMSSIDLFLLPYAMPDYFHRGSGFVIDAVTLGKPIVYSRGLGMSELLSNGNAEMASTPEEFAEKIVEVMSNPEDYRRGCESAFERLQACLEKTRQLLRSC